MSNAARQFDVVIARRRFPIGSLGDRFSAVNERKLDGRTGFVTSLDFPVFQNNVETIIVSVAKLLPTHVRIFQRLTEPAPSTLVFMEYFPFVPAFMFRVYSVKHLVLQSVDFNYHASFGFINTLFYCFPEMMTLDISDLKDEDAFQLTYPIKHSLRELFIRNSQVITGNMLLYIAESLVGLTHLAFIECQVKMNDALQSGIYRILAVGLQKLYLGFDRFILNDVNYLDRCLDYDATYPPVYVQDSALIVQNSLPVVGRTNDVTMTIADVLRVVDCEPWAIPGVYTTDGALVEGFCVSKRVAPNFRSK